MFVLFRYIRQHESFKNVASVIIILFKYAFYFEFISRCFKKWGMSICQHEKTFHQSSISPASLWCVSLPDNSKLIQTSFDPISSSMQILEYIWGRRNYSSIDASFNASFPCAWNFVHIRSSSNSCHFLLPSCQNVARRRFRFLLRSLDSRRGSNIYGNSM